MSWLAISFIGYAILAAVSILDKVILSKKQDSIWRLTCLTTAPTILVFIAIFFVQNSWVIGGSNLLIAAVSGFAFTAGIFVMYLGLLKSEASHFAPLVGGVIPLFILFLSNYFLGEVLATQGILAVMLLSLGTMLVAFEYRNHAYQLSHLMLWGVLAGLFFAISHVAAKYLYTNLGFTIGFVWSRGFIGISGLLFLLAPGFWQKTVLSMQKQNTSGWVIILFNKFLGLVGVVLIQYAIALGSVTLVNALAGLQYAILMIFAYLLSRFFPRFFQEEYSRMELWQETVSICLIIGGLVLLTS